MREWVCLLRAINLGARNKVPMPALRKALDQDGFEGVRTYVQSGNIVLRSEDATPDGVAARVRAIVKSEFGVDTPVLIRTAEEIRDVLAWNPFPGDATARPTAVHVILLDAEPDPSLVTAVVEADWGADGIVVRGREVCVRYAETMHRSRLQHATILRRLSVDGTARNWRTVAAIAALTALAD